MEDVVAQAAARGRKRYDIEDPQAPSWVLHRKHIFILSSAGKPIFSRYGDESKMAPLAGVLQALISFVRDTGDHIRHVRAGAHRMVFVTRGSLYLVGVSSSGDSVPYIARQLHFLHAQIISILTAKVETIFQKNASFDLRGLLGGTDRVLRTLIREGSSEPTMLLQATPCLRMPAATRAELGRLLAATRPAALLFGVLLSRGFLVQLLRLKRTPLHPHDLVLVSADAPAPPRQSTPLLPACCPVAQSIDRSLPTSLAPHPILTPRQRHHVRRPSTVPTPKLQTPNKQVMNTVNSSASFREDETWLPLCLPSFNQRAMLFAHISFVAPELCLVLITTTADAFAPLSLCRQQVVERLQVVLLVPQPHHVVLPHSLLTSPHADAPPSRLQEAEELRGPLFRAIAQPQYDVEEVGAAALGAFPAPCGCLYPSPSTCRLALPRSATSSTASPRTRSSPRRAPARSPARSARTATAPPSRVCCAATSTRTNACTRAASRCASTCRPPRPRRSSRGPPQSTSSTWC